MFAETLNRLDPALRGLVIEYRPVASLAPRAGNPRTHSKKQIRQIADSILQFGFTNPILIDATGGVIAGHGRLEAAKVLGTEAVPTIRLDHLNEAQKRAYVLADNKLAENAGWDRALLALELQYLDELDFDITVTGFETGEIDVLIGGLDDADDPDDAAIAVDANRPAVSRRGDLWQIGDHRLLCDDALNSESFAALMNGEKAGLVVIDPPYNVPVNGHVSGLGAVQHREFAMASGEMTQVQFTDFLKNVFGGLVRHSVDGAIHFVFMDWRHIGEVLGASTETYTELKNLCVWRKANGGMGSLYRSQHELVFVFKSGSASHVNNVELGRHGRYRTNVWDYPGANSIGTGRDADLAMHPTVKPVAMIADAIRDCSRRHAIVLDCFAGSGTTLVAAHRTGRIGYGMEIDPRYCDTIVRRMKEIHGLDAVLASTSQTFAEAEAGRTETAPRGADLVTV